MTLQASPKLRPLSDFGTNTKGFVTHAEEYRIYNELKVKMESIKRSLLSETPSNPKLLSLPEVNLAPSLESLSELTLSLTPACIPSRPPVAISEDQTISEHSPKLEEESNNKVLYRPLLNLLDAKYVNNIENKNPDERPILILESVKPSAKDLLEGLLHKHGKIPGDSNIDTKVTIKKKEATNEYEGEEMVIEKMKKLSCSQCSKIFSTYKQLWAHKQNCHDVASYCHECPKYFSSRKYLWNHRKNVHRGLLLICSECNFLCQTKKNMIEHELGEHRNPQDKEFSCTLCSQTFGTKKSLTGHILEEHGNEKDFPCQQCSHSFKTVNILLRHKSRVHIDRLFECSSCSQKFKRKYILTRHISHCGTSRLRKAWTDLSYSQKRRRAKAEQSQAKAKT